MIKQPGSLCSTAMTCWQRRKIPNSTRRLVRVAGFSDYFVNLAPNVQQEIIARTEVGEI